MSLRGAAGDAAIHCLISVIVWIASHTFVGDGEAAPRRFLTPLIFSSAFHFVCLKPTEKLYNFSEQNFTK